MIYERRHTREISALKGLQKAAPVMAGVFTLVMLSSLGLPGLNGFVGEFLILIGSFLTYRWWAVVAAAGVILAALYLLWAYQRVFHGEPDGDNADMPEMKGREFLALSPLLILIVFMGVYPKPMLDRIAPAVDELIAHVEVHTDYVQPEISSPSPGSSKATQRPRRRANEPAPRAPAGRPPARADRDARRGVVGRLARRRAHRRRRSA